jgi:hypothetical protein
LTDGNVDLLMPELRTYGIKNVGFLNIVKNWAKNSQQNLITKLDPVEGYKSFKLKGGSYQDTDAGKVWSGFFDVSVAGSKRSQDEDEENEDEHGNIYERAEQTLEDHRRNWKHLDVYLDENDGFLSYGASGSFSISKILFTVELGDWRDENYKTIKKIIEYSLDIGGLEEIQIDDDTNSYNFSFYFQNDDRYYDELTSFERFLDYVDDVDGDFQEKVNKVYKSLLEEGYIKDLSEKIEFKNFNIELDEDFTISTKEPEKIGYLQNYVTFDDPSPPGRQGIKIPQWNKDFSSLINKQKVLPFKVSENNFNLFLNTNSTSSSEVSFSDVVPSRMRASGHNLIKLTGWVYFNLTISLTLDLYKNSEVIKRLKNLDNNWDFYIKKLGILFDIFIRNKQAADPLHSFYKDLKNNQKILSQKPIFKKPQNQLSLNFKEWLESLSYEKVFNQRDETQKVNVGKLLGFSKNLNIIKQGSFATLYQHPKYKNRLIKITSHKEDIYNLVKAQKLKSKNIVEVFDWEYKQKIKELPSLNSWAIMVENVLGNSMIYHTNDFYELTLDGKYNLASDWIIQGGNSRQKIILDKYNKDNDEEYNKLFELFRTLYQLRKFYKIDLSDFEDNIIDSKDRYVLVDMGF